MSYKNRPYVGKDGNRYNDYFEKQGADTRYDQRQKLIEEQQETNRLIREQNKKIKNNGLSNNYYSSNYVSSNMRGGPLFLILALIIAPILIFSKLAIKYGIYILVAGLVVEVISAYSYNKKNKVTNHFFEISLLIVAILCFMITIIPISKIKNYIPIGDGTYTIYKLSGYGQTTKVKSFSIDGKENFGSQIEKLDIDEKITITINYSEFVNTNNKWVNKSKTVEFYPRAYFDELEKNKTLSSNYLDELYMISIEDILKKY